jgi:hypothetical protein
MNMVMHLGILENMGNGLTSNTTVGFAAIYSGVDDLNKALR